MFGILDKKEDCVEKLFSGSGYDHLLHGAQTQRGYKGFISAWLMVYFCVVFVSSILGDAYGLYNILPFPLRSARSFIQNTMHFFLDNSFLAV